MALRYCLRYPPDNSLAYSATESQWPAGTLFESGCGCDALALIELASELQFQRVHVADELLMGVIVAAR